MLSQLRLKNWGAISGPKNEHCVVCGCDTGIAREVLVQERKYYVQGCGQLCASCYNELKAERKWKFVE